MARIHDAMTRAGLSQTALAGRAGLSKAAMSRMLSGKRGIGAGELGVLAVALGVSVASLLGEPDQTPQRSRELALAARLAHADAEYPEAQDRARELLEVRDQLNGLVAAEATSFLKIEKLPSPSRRHIDQGTELAAQVRSELGLGDEPIEDISALVESTFGLMVAREPLDTDLVGLLVTDGVQAPSGAAAMALALVNSTDPVPRQRFTIAHELAHLLFGDANVVLPDYRDGKQQKHEWRANDFAGELLMPKGGVQALVTELGVGPAGSELHGEDAELLTCAVAATFNVSVKAAAIRCNRLRWLDPDEKERVKGLAAVQLLRRHGFADFAKTVTSQAGEIEPPATLARDALYAYTEGLVGLGTMARLWHADDPAALRRDFESAGYVPAFN
ncbi:ImmA/IrrE family metallo-endopeptidase [Nocardioidaceae bacterium]|nr:ImmA/IrrE family metallo-endopeptidase [Nocardioidaceae bacterium]